MSVLLDYLAKEGSVPLERYGHQVGGHHMLFKFRDELCKPVQPREHFFYQSAPDLIKRYIPSYHGVVDVSHIHHEDSGDTQVRAYPKPSQPDPVPPSQLGKSSAQVSAQFRAFKCTTGKSVHSKGTTVTSIESVGDGYKNPWAIMCSENLDRTIESLDGLTQEYMIIENLTSKFQSPCVLDLKVGTRQHGDDADAIKVLKHTKTCAISTSRNLGVRLAGMQKYNAAKNQFVFFDKYFGKMVKDDEFSKILLSFFHNGVCFRSDLIPLLISMLEDLQASVKALPTFRYYSCSLLIIYDGAVCPEGLARVVPALQDVDFDSITEKARTYAVDEAEERAIKDMAAKGGLTLNGATPKWYYDCVNGSPPTSPPTEHIVKEDESMSSKMTVEELSQARNHIDLRMIDFAHATHSGYLDPIKHTGCDYSYLKGLDTLLKIFRDAKRKYCDINECVHESGSSALSEAVYGIR